MPRGGLRAIPVCRVPTGTPGGVLVQGARVLPELRWPPHDRTRGALGGLRTPGRARTAMGADATVARRIERLFTRRGITTGGAEVDGCDPFADATPTLAGLAAASVRGVAALGPRTGLRVRRRGDERRTDRWDDGPRPWCARTGGFDLHAAVAVPAGARDRLKRLCRYALRPAVAFDEAQATPSLVEGWGRSGCACRRKGRSCWTCAADGPTGRRSWCLTRWSFWSGWRRWPSTALRPP